MDDKATMALVEVWFQDEAGVGQKGSLSYVWAPVGGLAPSLGAAGVGTFDALDMPKVVVRPLQPSFCCFPDLAQRHGEANNGPEKPF